MDIPGGSDSKESACNAGDPGSMPGSPREYTIKQKNPMCQILVKSNSMLTTKQKKKPNVSNFG